MNAEQTAVLLIGYQNDYFAPNGVLHQIIEESSRVTGVLANTVDLIEHLKFTSVTIVSTPIAFTPDYSELVDPVGILQTIKEKRAFQANTNGAQIITELRQFGGRIIEVSGKRGLNAFSNTTLDEVLQQHGITHVVIAGVVVSLCIDSTGRAAAEKGYKVSILSDCTSGRTVFEHEFYCGKIFSIYAQVMDHNQFLNTVKVRT
jgi:nicotinamidase-related amidase